MTDGCTSEKMVMALQDSSENTHSGGKDQCTAGILFNKIGFDKEEIMFLFVCSEAVEFNQIKLEARSVHSSPKGVP